MADTPQDTLESRTRANLAYILIIGALVFIGYILYMWGNQKEILTLIIGLIGGTFVGAPVGVYFAGAFTKKPDTPNSSTVVQTGDAPTTNVTPPNPPVENGG